MPFKDSLLNGERMPLFTDMPERVKDHILKTQPLPEDYLVYVSMENKYVTVEEYLNEKETS